MTFNKNNISLGIIIIPIAIITILLLGFSDKPSSLPSTTGWHIAISIPTYGIMCVAFSQACLIVIQDRQLNNIAAVGKLPELPPIQTMETNLFWLTLSGFCLMTVNIVLGIGSNVATKGELFEFTHHIILSILAWLLFAGLLSGRKLAGWRGEKVAKWTVFAFSILILAYFGTRFVKDFILQS